MNRTCLKVAAVAFLSLPSLPVVGASFDAPVKTDNGILSGLSLPNGIHAYLGIPFAAPPVGELRWRAPAPAASWSGVRKAESLAHVCMQAPAPAMPRSNQSEDCLYLNVWTGAQASNEKRPVMVWIHGGGNVYGAATLPQFNGAHLAQKGVVVVTIAYRLGVMGFLALPELANEAPYHSAGNYGILDQIAALKWVKANVANFGGDPNNVTLFGESAGSGDINILQATPLARGLFKRVIGESTSEMGPEESIGLAKAEQGGSDFEHKVGAKSLSELRRMDAAALTDQNLRAGPIQKDGYVLPDTVYNIFAKSQQTKVPVMVGANGDEGAVLHIPWVKPQTASEQKRYDDLYRGDTDKIRKSATDAVLWQMQSWIDFNSKAVSAPSYFYWFTHFPPKGANIGSAGKPYADGPVHTSEIVYVFNNLQVHNVPWTKRDKELADHMSTYWTNFAKTGNPNGNGLPQWPAYDVARRRVMNFNSADKAIEFPRSDAVAFVGDLMAKEREK